MKAFISSNLHLFIYGFNYRKDRDSNTETIGNLSSNYYVVQFFYSLKMKSNIFFIFK